MIEKWVSQFEIKKAIPVIIAVLLSIACIYRYPNAVMRASMEFSAVYVLSLIVAIWLAEKVDVWLGLFVIFCVFMHFYPKYNSASYTTLHNIILASGVLLYMSYHPEYFKYVFDVFLLFAVVNLVAIGFDIFNIRVPYRMYWGNDCEGIMANRNESAALFAFALPAAFRKGRYWAIAVIGIGLILTRTSGAVLAVMAGAIIYWRMKEYKYFGLFVLANVLAVLLYMLFIDAPDYNSRWIMWMGVLNAVLQKPMLGWGLGQYPVIYNHSPHNEFLRLVFETGVVSLLLWIGYTTWSAIDMYKREKLSHNYILCVSALAIIAVNSFVSFQLHIGTTAVMSLLWLGKYEEAKNDKC